MKVGAEACPHALTLDGIQRGRRAILDALFQLYAHDFSEHVPLELTESGRFEVGASDVWWDRDDHHPFFIRVSGRLAGFALVRRGSRIAEDAAVMDVAEFFVVRGERRKSVGLQAALALLGRFPGRWEVRVRESNQAALRFWSQVSTGVAVSSVLVSSPFRLNDVDWQLLRIEAR